MKTTIKVKKCALLLVAGLWAGQAAAGRDSLHGLLTDSHLDVTLKNIWMTNTTDALEEQGIGPQNAWAQGLLVDYRSGAYHGFGLDASWYGVGKLYANRSFAGRDLVRDNHGHAEGFSKLGQLYLRSYVGDATRFLQTKAGWQQLYKFGVLNVTRSRAAPSSWQGLSAEGRFEQLYARAALVNKFSERDEPEKRHFMTLSSNKRIDYIATADLTWQPQKGRAITLVGGESKDYIRRLGVESAWSQPLAEDLNLLLRGVYYYNQGLREWEGARGFSHQAQHLFGLVGIATARTEAGIGWSVTRARLDNNLGRFYWHLGKNTRGAFNSKADAPGNDYVNDGEQMLYGYGQYQISPEWLAGLYAYYGDHMRYRGVAMREWEYGGFISWAPERLPGFTLFAGLGPSYSWKLSHGKPALNASGDDFQRSSGIGGSFSLEYKFGLF